MTRKQEKTPEIAEKTIEITLDKIDLRKLKEDKILTKKIFVTTIVLKYNPKKKKGNKKT